MAGGEGEELPPVVIPLEGNDQAFLDMLDRDKEALTSFAEEVKGILAEGIASGGEAGAEQLVSVLRGAASEAGSEIYEVLVDNIQQAGADAGLGFRERMQEETQPLPEEIAATFEEATPEFAAAGAEAGAAYGESLREELAATAATFETYVKDDLRRGLDEEAQADMAALAQVQAQIAALDTHGALPGAGGSAGGNAAAAAATASAAAATEQLNGQLRQTVAVLGSAAQAADTYGTSEAQLAVSTQALQAAQSALGDAGVSLLGVYSQLGDGGTLKLGALQAALKNLSDAQAAVTAQAAAQVEAMNAVNLAVLENDTAIMDDSVAMQGFVSAAQASGVEVRTLTEQLLDGNYAALDNAAAMAKQELRAIALQEAQQRLAAANLTVVDTYRRLAEGAEVSAEAQKAAMDSVTKAQSEVSALGGAGAAGQAEKSSGGGMGMMGMGGIGGMLLWNLPFMLPMLGQMFDTGGQKAQAYYQQLQQLGSAIQQDGGQIGATTEAALANQIAYSSLSDSLARYGVNLTQATEYASGVTAVQQVVNAQLNNQAAALEKVAQYASAATAQGSSAIPGDNTVEGIQAQAAKDAQQSLSALAAAAQKAVEKQNEVSAATLAAEKATGVFNGQVKAAELSMQQQAQTAFVSAAATQNWLDTVVPGTQLYSAAIQEQVVALKYQAQQADITAAAQQQYLAWLVPGTAQYTRAIDDQFVALQAQATQTDIAAGAQQRYLAWLVPGTQQYTRAVQDQATAQELQARQALIAGQAQMQVLQMTVPGMQQFNDAVTVQRDSLLQSAAAAGVAALAQLNLDGATVQQQADLFGAVDAYNRATAATNGYSAVLTALDGTTQNFVISEAQFTIALDNVSKAAQNNGTSLDVSNVKGAQNLLMFGQLSQAADKAAESLYQAEVGTKGANQAFNDANASLEREKEAFIAAADKAGFDKGQVQQLADALFKLPKDVPINVSAQVQGAKNAVSALIYGIDSESATINVFARQNYSSSGLKFNASGGAVQRGVPSIVGDTGGRAEMFVPSTDGYVYPSVDQGLGALAAQGYFGGQPLVNVQVLIDGHQATGPVRATTQYFANRNSTTGFAGRR